MFYKRKVQSAFLTLCCLLVTTSCWKQWGTPPSYASKKHFELKLATERLEDTQKNISFKVVQRSDSHTPGMPVLRLVRKEGKNVFIADKKGRTLKEIEPGIFEYPIQNVAVDIQDLCLKMDDEEVSKAVFELELVYDGMYQEGKKSLVWKRKQVKLSLNELPSKLYNVDKQLPFKIKYKGKEPLDYTRLVLVFARKEGKANIQTIGNQASFKANQKSGIFELALDPKDLGHINRDLSLDIALGETKATFQVYIAYKGTQVGEAKRLCWQSKQVSYALKEVTHELRGKNKDIAFAVSLKGQDFATLKDALVLRITKKLNSNARIVGALEGITPSVNTTNGVFEFSISKSMLEKYFVDKGKGLLRGLSIAVDQGDTKAQFELQLVYDKMAVGKPQLITWRDADVQLELVNTPKKIRGENLQPIQIGVQQKGEGDLEENQTRLRLKRLPSNTNAQIILSGTDLKNSTNPSLEVGPGIFEVPISNSEIAAKVIDKLCIQTNEGDKEAKFELQLVYKGMEIGKPVTLTWQPKDVKLKITGLVKGKRLVGQQNKSIDLRIENKGKDKPDPNKSLVLRMTRKKGKEAKIVGTVHGKEVKTKGKEGSSFELTLDPTHIGQMLHGLQVEVREGETKAAFELQLFYDGVAMGTAKTFTWEAEQVQLVIEKLTKNLRGDQRTIQLKINNKNIKQPLEKDVLLLRLTRKKGYQSVIAHVKGSLGTFVDQGNGLYELSLNKSDIGRDIAALQVIPRVGELQAEFTAQLVYDGMEVGEAQMITWLQKDIQLSLVNGKVENEGRIKFTIQQQGKDAPENNKLAIRFKRVKGHMAAIGRRSTNENMQAHGNLALAQETGEGFFEFPLDSKEIGKEIADFVVIPRKGERKAEFIIQLVHDQVEIGKAVSIVWEAPALVLSLDNLSTALYGDSEQGTAIGFKIRQEKATLEDGKLSVRFTRTKGFAAIEAKPHAGMTTLRNDLLAGVFEFGIPVTQVDQWIQPLKVVPKEREERSSIFTTELIYDGNKIGKSQDMRWMPQDIRLELSVANRVLGGDVKREVQGEDHIIKFKVNNKGKDLSKSEKLFLRLERINGRRVEVKLTNTATHQLKNNSEEGYFTYEIDTQKLGIETNHLAVDEVTGEASADFRLYLMYDQVKVSNEVNISWENIAMKKGILELERQNKEKERNNKRDKEAGSNREE
eukprot:gene711-882_t